MHNKS